MRAHTAANGNVHLTLGIANARFNTFPETAREITVSLDEKAIGDLRAALIAGLKQAEPAGCNLCRMGDD